MVEEMMLLANVTVAEHVLSRFAGCTLLRRHQVPPPRQFEPLLKAAHAAHFSLDISSSKVRMPLACPFSTLLYEVTSCLQAFVCTPYISPISGAFAFLQILADDWHSFSFSSNSLTLVAERCLQALAESLDKAQRLDDAYFNKLVRIMATRCMTQAAYFGSGEVAPPEYYHYGLAAPLYTHFTSPIRR